MIQLRGVCGDKEVVEMALDTKCRLIDGLHYVETNKVQYIGAETTLQELRAFEMVEVDTGIDDDEQPRVMTILPKKRYGFANLLATLVLASSTVGCSGTTYHYSYTCHGQSCVPPPNYVVMYRHAVPQQARVLYVDSTVETPVRRGTIDGRRAAQPRRRTQ